MDKKNLKITKKQRKRKQKEPVQFKPIKEEAN